MDRRNQAALVWIAAALMAGCGARSTGEDGATDVPPEAVDADAEDTPGSDATDVGVPDLADDDGPGMDVADVTDADDGTDDPATDVFTEPVPCEDVGDCDGGPCSQGYCCDEDCPGTTCARCDVAGREGLCVRLSGNTCDDDDNCTLADRCDDGECAAGAQFCEGRPCENCLGEEWHLDLGDWCVELGGMPTCFCLCV